jgi:hypothetical protein
MPLDFIRSRLKPFYGVEILCLMKKEEGKNESAFESPK